MNTLLQSLIAMDDEAISYPPQMCIAFILIIFIILYIILLSTHLIIMCISQSIRKRTLGFLIWKVLIAGPRKPEVKF